MGPSIEFHQITRDEQPAFVSDESTSPTPDGLGRNPPHQHRSKTLHLRFYLLRRYLDQAFRNPPRDQARRPWLNDGRSTSLQKQLDQPKEFGPFFYLPRGLWFQSPYSNTSTREDSHKNRATGMDQTGKRYIVSSFSNRSQHVSGYWAP